MSARDWLERLRGNGRSAVVQLEPADCRELAAVVAELLAFREGVEAAAEKELADKADALSQVRGSTPAHWQALERERDEARAQLASVAERQREACAKQAYDHSGPEYEIPRRVARDVALEVRATPLVTGPASVSERELALVLAARQMNATLGEPIEEDALSIHDFDAGDDYQRALAEVRAQNALVAALAAYAEVRESPVVRS